MITSIDFDMLSSGSVWDHLEFFKYRRDFKRESLSFFKL